MFSSAYTFTSWPASFRVKGEETSSICVNLPGYNKNHVTAKQTDSTIVITASKKDDEQALVYAVPFDKRIRKVKGVTMKDGQLKIEFEPVEELKPKEIVFEITEGEEEVK